MIGSLLRHCDKVNRPQPGQTQTHCSGHTCFGVMIIVVCCSGNKLAHSPRCTRRAFPYLSSECFGSSHHVIDGDSLNGRWGKHTQMFTEQCCYYATRCYYHAGNQSAVYVTVEKRTLSMCARVCLVLSNPADVSEEASAGS